MLAALNEVLIRSPRWARMMLGSALRFGRSIARGYLGSTASAALPPGDARARARGWDVADVVMVTEVMALAFVQVSGVLIAIWAIVLA